MKREHLLQTVVPVSEVGPVELRRAADLIKRFSGMQEVNESAEDAKSEHRAQGGVMGYTDRSIYLCPRCFVVISNLEYVHLNLNGLCDECETALERYVKVEWRP